MFLEYKYLNFFNIYRQCIPLIKQSPLGYITISLMTTLLPLAVRGSPTNNNFNTNKVEAFLYDVVKILF